jgi:hypothetical protein
MAGRNLTIVDSYEIGHPQQIGVYFWMTHYGRKTRIPHRQHRVNFPSIA